jgi:hypothetical protein
METMVQRRPVGWWQSNGFISRQEIVEHRSNPTDTKREDETFDVEPGRLGEIKKARRVPIGRHE